MTDATAPPPTVDGVAILLWSADPAEPHRLATPFAMAAAAAAFDTPVELYFTARSVLLLRPGAADALRASAHPKTIGDWLREAAALGVAMFACTDALDAHGVARDALVPQCGGHGGAVQFMARACDPRWRALVF